MLDIVEWYISRPARNSLNSRDRRQFNFVFIPSRKISFSHHNNFSYGIKAYSPLTKFILFPFVITPPFLAFQINRVMHSDVFELRRIGLKANRMTKSQQNNWLLGLQVYTLYMKIMYQYLPGGGAILEPEHH